ncbi:hypothetical protein D9M72_523380 [compost metagenome]
MPVDHQGAGGGVLPRNPGDHVGPARRRFENLCVQPHFGDEAGGVFRSRALPGTCSVAVVRSVYPDQFLADPDNFILGAYFSHVSLLVGAARLLVSAYPQAPSNPRLFVSRKVVLESFSLLRRNPKR